MGAAEDFPMDRFISVDFDIPAMLGGKWFGEEEERKEKPAATTAARPVTDVSPQRRDAVPQSVPIELNVGGQRFTTSLQTLIGKAIKNPLSLNEHDSSRRPNMHVEPSRNQQNSFPPLYCLNPKPQTLTAFGVRLQAELVKDPLFSRRWWPR